MRAPRQHSANDIYHVVARGTGRQIIFEDDEDRSLFLSLLSSVAKRYGAEIYAWCLMSNHVHILVYVDFNQMALMMKSLLGSYAERFNAKTGRTGHLFQERYKSEPIDDEAYLLTVTRYIHQNPEKAGLSKTSEYAWSSFHEYMDGPRICNTSFVLSLFSDKDSFAAFHRNYDDTSRCIDSDGIRGRTRAMPDELALTVASEVLGELSPDEIKTLAPLARNEKLRLLRDQGLTIRQIERITGIGRGVIARV